MSTPVVKIFTFFVSLFFFGFSVAQDLPANQLTVPDKPYPIPFIWKGDSINGKWDENAAMLIPVKLNNCPRDFYMQFDLGSPYSLFYTNKLAAISQRYPMALRATDTTTKLSDLPFSIAGMKISAKEIVTRPLGTAAINWNQKKIEVIGTLGTDLIDDRSILIDYPGQQIMINYQPGDSLLKTDLYYSRRSILFPAVINGKRTILYFDTGSSAFELLTNKEMVLALATPGAEPVKYKVSSWGKMLEATSLATADSVEMAFTKIPLKTATYIEGASDAQVQQMMKMGIGGMTGNKLFIRSRLFLDLKNKKFAIMPRKQ